MAAIDRTMKMYLNGDVKASPCGKEISYTFNTLVYEQQVADDAANDKGVRQGEGHWTVFNNDGEVLKKLDFPL